jgi:autotransporter-associated beta strand protein
LTGSNSFSGPTTIAVGGLQASSTNALSSNSVLGISNGASLSIANFNNTVAGLNGSGSVTLGSATLTIAGLTNTSSTYGGNISGTGGVDVAGASTETLTGSNSYSGGTILSGGGLSITNGNALGSGTLTVTGGVLSLGSNTVVTNALAPVTGGTITGGTFLNNGGNYTLGSGTISSVLAGTDGVIKTGAGTVTLAASNSYSGGTSLGGGTVIVATNGALGSGTATFTANTTLADTAGSGTDTISNALVLNTGVTGTISDPNSNGNVTISGVVSGLGNLGISGPGPVTLTQPATYTGATYVTSGSLVIGSGSSLSNSTPIYLGSSSNQGTLNLTSKTTGYTLGTNQTLAGINGLVTIGSATLTANGPVSPGQGTTNGTLGVTGNLTLGSASVLTFKVTSTNTPGVTFDKLTVSGKLTYNGAINFVLNTGSPFLGTYQIITSGSVANDPSTIALTGSWNPSSFTYTGSGIWTDNQPSQYPVSFNDITGVLTVAVPEPSTWALLGVSMVAALLFRRKFGRRGENVS